MTAERHAFALTLQELLPEQDLAAAAQITVTGLSLDSRKVRAGEVFMAVIGTRSDGRLFVKDAIDRGAVAVLVEADDASSAVTWMQAIPVVAVPRLSQQVSHIAARFYQQPSASMAVTGITGTNGKTTCSLLLGQVCAMHAERAAVIGTVGSGLLDATAIAPLGQQLDALQSTGLTTPDAVSVQALLADMRAQKARHLAMEVSSHSLVQGRVAAVTFTCAVFTNLTRDHLDYHGDMESYGKAKAQLLNAPGLRYAICNYDDPWARGLLQQLPADVQGFSYSTRDTGADVCATNIRLSTKGIQADVRTPWGQGEIYTALLGDFNLSNLLAVIAAACAQGLPFAGVLQSLPCLQPAPGRMQAVTLEQSGQDIGVIVDYAHSPDALENTLVAMRAHQCGRIWTVFGCGGDRDRSKRPLMGRIAERLSDYVIVTNDNPRSEDPAVIAAEILRGMHNTHGCLVIADRAQAIDLAIQQAKAGDLVLIAGKGHEDYQIFAAQTLPFSDVKYARLSLQRRLVRRDSKSTEKRND